MATSTTEHCKILLAAIIPNRRDLLDRASRHLTPEHFTDSEYRNIFVMLQRYADVTGCIITPEGLSDILSNAGVVPGKRELYEEIYARLFKMDIDEGKFLWSLQQLRDLAAQRDTHAALTQAMEILQQGAVDSKGNRVYGHADARAHALVKITEVDRDLSLQGAPEGDIREEGADILAAYAEGKQRRLEGRSKGILFGIRELDEKTDGLQKADLCLMVGFSSSGKTSSVVQLAWHAATQQGKNVVFLTTETIREQVTRKIIARHSKLPQFDLPDGIDTNDLKRFILLPEIEDKFREVVSDFTHNPEYGKCYVAQVPQGATMGTVSAQLMRLQRQFPIDLAIMDYFGLLRADRKRKDMREELCDIIKEAKQFATTFDDGNGLPFVSPWQVNRTSRDNARVSGGYTTSALAETAEATNSSDLIISLLEPEDNNDRYAMLKGQILKARDGITSASIMIQADYATSTFSSPSTASSLDNLLTGDDY